MSTSWQPWNIYAFRRQDCDNNLSFDNRSCLCYSNNFLGIFIESTRAPINYSPSSFANPYHFHIVFAQASPPIPASPQRP